MFIKAVAHQGFFVNTLYPIKYLNSEVCSAIEDVPLKSTNFIRHSFLENAVYSKVLLGGSSYFNPHKNCFEN